MTPKSHVILVIEDSDDDFMFFQRACRQLGAPVTLQRLHNADEARAYLEELNPKDENLWPILIFLDLNLPGTDGRSFLQELKTSEQLKVLPVVVYSTSTSIADVRFCYANHANAFHQKHLDYDQMKSELSDILQYWTTRVRPPTRHE